MKKLLSIILALAMMIIPVFAFSGSTYAADTVTLNVYNWGQYISDGTDGYIDVIAEFEAAYPNIKVNYMTFDSNETMYTKLQTDPYAYDVIVPSDYMIQKLISEDRLEELNFDNIPNYEYLDDSFKNMAYDPENKYSVPYTWGYVGIIYNSKYVNEEDTGSWDLLWNPTYAGKILMFDNPRDAFAAGELLLGYGLNTEDEEELSAVTEKLKEQKNLVQAYVMDQIFDKMEREEAWIAPYYAGDYLLMVEENEDLSFYAPEEGFNLFVDALCIPKGARNKEAAELFINFLCSPEICGPNLEYLGYSTPFSAAKEYMDEEMNENEIAYPSEELLSKGQAFNALSVEGSQLMNELWLSVKTSDNVLGRYIIFTCAALVLVIILWAVLAIRKKRRISKRCGGYEK
ncbi:MAG: spermidine/putrescine ABC transporter substrate-binding protein [Lachnospiraceae bacterium]|nr:spermidine/putrescine ABC transporter substrate-binding protein [Lachnospiraceae bacterium]